MEEQRVRELEGKVAKLETFTGIDDPDAGLRGEIGDLKRSINALFSAVRNIEKRLYLAIGGATVVLWILENKPWK